MVSGLRICLVCGLVIVFGLMGCASGGKSPRQDRLRLVEPRLQVQFSDSERLLRTNLIAVAPVRYNPRLTDVRGLEARIQEMLTAQVKKNLRVETVFIKPDQMIAQGDIRQAAESIGANGLLVVDLREYREREGSEIGASRGAEVGFYLALSAVVSGEPVWRANYFFQDKALTDNLLEAPKRLKKGEARWVSALSALERGFSEALSKLEAERVSQFRSAQRVF